MKTQRALLLAGSFWEFVRFFLMLLIIAELLGSAGAGAWVYPWLLMVGSGNLLIAGGGVMLALYPDRYPGLAPFLRLGKVMSVFSFLLLIVSGAVRVGAAQAVGQIAGVPLPRIGVLLAIFVFDLLFLAVLFLWRKGVPSPTALPPGSASGLPEYRETEVGDFH